MNSVWWEITQYYSLKESDGFLTELDMDHIQKCIDLSDIDERFDFMREMKKHGMDYKKYDWG